MASLNLNLIWTNIGFPGLYLFLLPSICQLPLYIFSIKVHLTVLIMKLKAMRTAVQIVALAFFTGQLVAAVRKYMSKPTMISEGSKTISDVETPLMITVCQQSQYNRTKVTITITYNFFSLQNIDGYFSYFLREQIRFVKLFISYKN